MSLQAIFDALTTALAPVAPLVVGKRTKGLNVDLPYIFLLLGRDTYAGPQGPGGSANPRALHAQTVGVEFHCWALDYGAANDLKNAVITALRSVMNGANYLLDGGEWVDAENVDRGVVYVLSARLVIAVPLMNLAAPPTNADDTTVVVTDVQPDNSSTVSGDGFLDWGETDPPPPNP